MQSPAQPDSDAPNLSWSKRVAFSLIAMGFVLVVVVLFAEVVLRLVAFEDFRGTSHTIEDPELTWINKASAETEVRGPDFRYEVHTNSLGLRGPELEESATGRILLLGDSYTFGAGVNDDETFAARLDEMVQQSGPQGWEVVNGGVSGFGAMQSRLFAKRLWDQVQPNVVVYAHCGNDFGDDLRFSKGSYRSLRNRIPGRRFLKEHSVVYNLVKPIVLAALSKLGIYNPQIEFEAEGNEGALVSSLGETWSEGRDLTCEALGQMQQDAARAGASFAVTTVGFWPTEEGIEFSSDAEAVAECARKQGIVFLDPTVAFPDHEEEPWSNPNSAGHFSPLGNRLFAASIDQGLDSEGLITRDATR